MYTVFVNKENRKVFMENDSNESIFEYKSKPHIYEQMYEGTKNQCLRFMDELDDVIDYKIEDYGKYK